MKITYDLTGPDEFIEYTVRLLISLDGGQTFETEALTQLEGAYGKVSAGANQVIYWNALEAFPEGLDGQYRFKVVVTVVDSTPNSSPNKPRLKSPTNNREGLSTVTSLEWFAAADPDGDEVEYDVYIGRFQDPNTLIQSNAQGFLVNTPVLVAGSVYSWRVVARDPDGATTSSDIWYFTTGGSSENQNSGIDWAGITNPASGLTLTHKYHANYFNGDKYRFDGWSTTGQVSWIQLYINNSRVGSANNANSGSWYLEREMDAGVNSIYIISACNFNGCARDGVRSVTRTVTYVPDPSGDHIASRDLTRRIEVNIFGYSLGGTSTYFQVFRSDENQVEGKGWKLVSSWSTDTIIIDDDVEPEKEYYYFFRAAPNANGTYDSNFSNGAYGYARN